MCCCDSVFPCGMKFKSSGAKRSAALQRSVRAPWAAWSQRCSKGAGLCSSSHLGSVTELSQSFPGIVGVTLDLVEHDSGDLMQNQSWRWLSTMTGSALPEGLRAFAKPVCGSLRVRARFAVGVKEAGMLPAGAVGACHRVCHRVLPAAGAAASPGPPSQPGDTRGTARTQAATCPRGQARTAQNNPHCPAWLFKQG